MQERGKMPNTNGNTYICTSMIKSDLIWFDTYWRRFFGENFRPDPIALKPICKIIFCPFRGVAPGLGIEQDGRNEIFASWDVFETGGY